MLLQQPVGLLPLGPTAAGKEENALVGGDQKIIGIESVRSQVTTAGHGDVAAEAAEDKIGFRHHVHYSVPI